MSNVYIGHARMDENGKATGGTAGDQTGKELRTQSWYNGGWDFLARAKDPTVAAKIAAACEAGCANDKIGYDQYQRNTLLTEGQKVDWDLAKIANDCECDCSSFVSCCVIAGGIQIWSGGNAPTTRTLRKVLQATGAFDILTDAAYLTGPDRLCRGDILCKEGSHTVVVLSDGKAADRLTQGTASTASAGGNSIRSSVTYAVKLPLIQRGDCGPLVAAVQQLLLLRGADPGDIDGEYGPNTEAAAEEFQRSTGLEIDGKVGGQTYGALLGV